MQMSTAHFRTAAISCVLFPFLFLSIARAEALGPFKDDLFSAQNVMETRDGGDFTIVDYDEMRDINGRDSIPERRVKDRYVSLKVRRQQENQRQFQTRSVHASPLPALCGHLTFGAAGIRLYTAAISHDNLGMRVWTSGSGWVW